MKFSAKLVANFRRSLEGDFRASFAGENRQKHFPPKLHRRFHHQTSLRGSGLWRALVFLFSCNLPILSASSISYLFLHMSEKIALSASKLHMY